MHKVYSILNIQSTIEALLIIMSLLFPHKKNNFLGLTVFFPFSEVLHSVLNIENLQDLLS